MAGYQRQDTNNNIANGNVIDADDFDNEFNALEDAFNASTGHNHDGSPGGGATLTSIGPSSDFVVTATEIKGKTTNTLDVGTSTVPFKDGFFDGTLNTDLLSVDETSTFTGEATFNGGIVGDLTGDVTGDIRATDGTIVFNNGSDGTNAVYTGAVTGDITGDVKNTDGTVILDSGTDVVTAVLTGNLKGDVYANDGTSKILEAGTDGTNASLIGNADTASAWQNTRTITFATGDVTGTFDVDGSADVVDIALTIEDDSVALGTKTTGSYVESITQGTGVTIADANNGLTDDAEITISIGQDVGTTALVAFGEVEANFIGDIYARDGNGDYKVLENGTDGTDAVFTGNVTGDVTGNVSGNAGTATTLQTARNIGGVSFNGSADINLPGVNATGNQDTSGNAATASSAAQLTTARTISLTGDVTGTASFDGSSNISIATTGGSQGATYTAGAGIDISAANAISIENDLRGEVSYIGSSTSDYMYSASSNFYWYINGGLELSLNSSGDLTATGNVTAYSDERLKDNIRTVDNALNMVGDMRGVFYDKEGKAGVGVIAQEMQKVLPEAVHDEGEYLSVAYGNVVGVLIEAIKELKAEVEELKNGSTE